MIFSRTVREAIQAFDEVRGPGAANCYHVHAHPDPNYSSIGRTNMAHQYKRRTMVEAIELALGAFREECALHLSSEDREELAAFGTMTSGSPADGWEELAGTRPTDRDYYELKLYKPDNKCPYVSKIYARILVPRNRDSSRIHFIWRPAVAPYVGPHFE